MSSTQTTSSESTNTTLTPLEVSMELSMLTLNNPDEEKSEKEILIGCGEAFVPKPVNDKPKFRTFSYGEVAKPEDINTINFNNTPVFMVFNDIHPVATLSGTHNIAMLCNPESDDVVLHKPFVHLVNSSGKSLGIVFVRDYQQNLMVFNTKNMLKCNPEKCKVGNYCYGIDCCSVFHTRWLENFFEKIQDNINNNKIKTYRLTGISECIPTTKTRVGEKQFEREANNNSKGK